MGEKIRPSEEINSVEKEKSPEHHPSYEEIKSKIFEFVAGRSCVEGRLLEDERGLYLLDITTEPDEDGYTAEYSYSRKGPQPKGRCPVETKIHVTNYKNYFPVSGESVAMYNYETGKWENHALWISPPPFEVGKSRIGIH